MSNIPNDHWKSIKEAFEKLIPAGYTFDVTVNDCTVYRFEEPIFGMRGLNDPNDLDDKNGLLTHWSAALGAAMAHQQFYPNQTQRVYQGLDY